MAGKMIHFFGEGRAEGDGSMKRLLGGKGAGLAEMTNAGIPVPPGFTITARMCGVFYENGMRSPKALDREMERYLRRLEKVSGKGLGDHKNPLLVSVRSGAMVSMPGMMDTILNLGLNDLTVEGMSAKTGNARFSYDCYRRFIGMFGNVVMGLDKDVFEAILERRKHERKMTQDIEMTEEDMRFVSDSFKDVYREKTGEPFPQDPFIQLKMARDAVFRSWQNQRAITYRKMYSIPDDMGTAVNVQMMVFGNMGTNSGTGVGFTRDPSTGEKRFYGEFLFNAQGEDVVAGIRTPLPIDRLKDEMPETYARLHQITQRLERHYRDMQDFEFTIENGRLYMLQTRNGKRTGHAAVKVAVDMVNERMISRDEAVMRVDAGQINQLLHPVFDSAERSEFHVIGKGLPASPGAAAGKVVFNADEAVRLKAGGERCLLVRKETSPDDIHGVAASAGILTATGGMTSHAAVVSRQMGKPSVVGCTAIVIDEEQRCLKSGDIRVDEGDYVSIDGSTGEVFVGDVPTKPSEVIQVLNGTLEAGTSASFQYYRTFMSWADKRRRLGVYANADIPRDADMAIKFGAEGIGLCRTEHMFFAEERVPLVRRMILAESKEEIDAALADLLPLQREDFKGLFEIMDGYPVTIRTLDPPLHEFLPKREEIMTELAVARYAERQDVIAEKTPLLKRVEELHEFNPMMGRRGCRLGITFPEVTGMQVRAIFEAACDVAGRGKKVLPEIMIPIVGELKELQHQKEIVDRIAAEVMNRTSVKVHYQVGTMIEVPRAALTADEIAAAAEFFSFGTNDLTQMTFAYSRDDSGRFLPHYIDKSILSGDPFVSVDQRGVGELMKIAIERGRRTKPGLTIGVCGEHGGDAESVKFCHRIGLNYVSCSPYRLPIARLAAAQAAILEDRSVKSPARRKNRKK